MDYIKSLIGQDAIEEREFELAREIHRDYKDKKPVIICILKGAIYFFTDLTRKLDIDCELDFMRVSSYEGEESKGKLKIKIDLDTDIKDRDVIIVEDIIDTGLTLSELKKYLEGKGAKSVNVCCLLDKPDRRKVDDINPEYVGFTIPNEFVIGYGLDYNEAYRTIPFVGVLTHDKEKEPQKSLVRKKTRNI